MALRPHVLGRWLFSHEDEDGTRVYRPRDGVFAPSRRPREGFDIEADGTFRVVRPGPADAPIATGARWREAGDAIEVTSESGAVVRTLRVVDAAPGVLKLR